MDHLPGLGGFGVQDFRVQGLLGFGPFQGSGFLRFRGFWDWGFCSGLTLGFRKSGMSPSLSPSLVSARGALNRFHGGPKQRRLSWGGVS